MLFPGRFFSIESSKITVIGAFVFVFLFDIIFTNSLLESELLPIGSFLFRSRSFSLMSSCKSSNEGKSLLLSAFLIFDDFQGV